MRTASESQPDLFARHPAEIKTPLFSYTIPLYIQKIRRPIVHAMLEQVQTATTFPWANLTDAMNDELKFNGLARLFPPPEGRALLEAYAAEITRVYALIDEPWMPLYYSVLRCQHTDLTNEPAYIDED